MQTVKLHWIDWNRLTILRHSISRCLQSILSTQNSRFQSQRSLSFTVWFICQATFIKINCDLINFWLSVLIGQFRIVHRLQPFTSYWTLQPSNWRSTWDCYIVFSVKSFNCHASLLIVQELRLTRIRRLTCDSLSPAHFYSFLHHCPTLLTRLIWPNSVLAPFPPFSNPTRFHIQIVGR
jgi:hypothetical protein